MDLVLTLMTSTKRAMMLVGISTSAAALAIPVLAQATINGAGASFPAPFYQRAFAGAANKSV